MSVQTQIDRIKAAKTDISAAIAAKGVTVPSTTKIDGMAAHIRNISQAEDLDSVLDTQETKLNQLLTILDGKAAGGGGGASLETCTVTVKVRSHTDIVFQTVTDGVISYSVAYAGASINAVCNNVLCSGSVSLFGNSAYMVAASKISGEGELIAMDYTGTAVFKAPTTAGAETTFEIYDDD